MMKKSTFELKLPINYNNDDLFKAIKKNGVKKVETVEIIRKSLDARKKNNIMWNIEVQVNHKIIPFLDRSETILNIPIKKHEKKIIVVGSGPSGIFAAIVLLKAGFQVTILEKGKSLEKRDNDIDLLMMNGIFNKDSNFAFGEGGAGTYSDGKLTSRNKHISKEKDFILSTYINNGAPQEIYHLVHPHIGSDNLKDVTTNLRKQFLGLGGEILFETAFLSFFHDKGKVTKVETNIGLMDCDYLLLATGHSSFSTYRQLIKSGLSFNTKNFAVGFRAEHPQSLINRAQWGVDHINGLKAAEYRLTSKTETSSVFSFCMCPGGIIVPAAASSNTSVVNGMSNYNRDGEFANAAVVASFNFTNELKRDVSPLESLDLLQQLEEKYFSATNGYSIPGMLISDFISGKESENIGKSSYPLGITPYNLDSLLPKSIISPLKQGLKDFSKKIAGYETGKIIGLESKTSSPIQVVRDLNGLCSGFTNLYFTGEGSGWAGGIISSGADGIKGALDIINREC